MAEKGKGKSRKRRHFEIDKSRQSPFQNSFSKPASSTVVSKAPRAINVAEFAESRALEIQNMMMALGNAASVSNKRVFQSVPRHMRRRAASHNSKRMPVRLRDAYNREAAKAQEKRKEPKKKRSRHHRRRPSNLLDEYNRRQRKHVWLETHIWHAKRFKMVEKWGYMVPLHPNDKSVRASYRAMATGCLMQDISFYQCVEVRGRQDKIIAAMKHLTNRNAGLTMAAKQYLNGSREGHVTLYKYDKYPWGAIGPVRFLWQQELCGDLGVENVDSSEEPITADNVVTKLWVWSHPACCDEVLKEIVHACSLEGNTQLSDVKKKRKDEETESGSVKPEVFPESNTSHEAYELLVTVLREQLVRFRLTGPKSHALLASTMELCEWGNTKDGEGQHWWQSFCSDPAHLKNVTDQNALWEQMKGVTSPGVLVSGSVVAVVVKDPRLGLPLRKSSVDVVSKDLYKGQMDEQLTSCNMGSACSPLWNVTIRQEVKQTKVSEKELNELRSKILVPGSKLDLGEDTSRIPILVIQRPGTSGDTKTGSVAFGCGYDVIIPAGWSMAFWIALVYRGARVGGTREMATCLREQALPHFPCDFPDTSAGRECNDEQKRTAGDKHEKYPPAKRPNYDKLGVASPFSGDWERLVNEWDGDIGRLQSETENFISSGNPEETKASEESRISVSDENSINRVEETPLGSCEMVASSSSPTSFYVIRSRSILRRLQHISQLLDHAVCSKRTSSAKDDAFDSDDGFLRSHLGICARSLIGLDLRLLSKGCPLMNAVIFAPTAEDLRRLNEDKSYGGPVESPRKSPGETGAECGALIGGCTRRAIGYVTSGQYSFARGHGAAVGFCAFPGFCELIFVARRAKCRPLVLVRNTTSFQYRFASFAIL